MKDIKFPVSPEEFKRRRKKERESIREFASKIEAGEELTEVERHVIAGLLRSYADSLPDKQKGKPGNPKNKLPPDFSMVFVAGPKFKSQNKAIEYYAEKYQVDTKAIKKRLDRDEVTKALYPVLKKGTNSK